MGTITLAALDTDQSRAALMFDYANDPRGLMADLMSALSEAGYDNGSGIGAEVPDDLCTRLTSVIGAAMFYEVWQRHQSGADMTAYDVEEAQVAAHTITHAAERGDSLARAIYGLQFFDIITAIEDWVLGNLADSMADASDLLVFAGDFAAWESDDDGPDAA